jgi:hypothetical protein
MAPCRLRGLLTFREPYYGLNISLRADREVRCGAVAGQGGFDDGK